MIKRPYQCGIAVANVIMILLTSISIGKMLSCVTSILIHFTLR